jgi:hypothetical protein
VASTTNQESILDAPKEEGIVNPVVISNAPIALKKPVRYTKIHVPLKDCVGYKHDVAKYISYEKCSPSFKGFIASLDLTSIPSKWDDAIKEQNGMQPYVRRNECPKEK